MILRDGRREVHDLGARRTFEPSMLGMIGDRSGSGAGAWTGKDMHSLFRLHDKPVGRPLTAPSPKVAPSTTRRPRTAPAPLTRRPGGRDRRPDRMTCETGRHPRPEVGRCVECKRQAVRDFRARQRGTVSP